MHNLHISYSALLPDLSDQNINFIEYQYCRRCHKLLKHNHHDHHKQRLIKGCDDLRAVSPCPPRPTPSPVPYVPRLLHILVRLVIRGSKPTNRHHHEPHTWSCSHCHPNHHHHCPLLLSEYRLLKQNLNLTDQNWQGN